MKKKKSNLRIRYEKFRERQAREFQIEREELKSGKIPFSLQWFFASIGFTFLAAIAIGIFININEKYWIPIILFFQLVFIFTQLWFIRLQTKIFKLSHLPEFVVYKDLFFSDSNTSSVGITIENIGETAHRVNYEIKTDRKQDLDIKGEKTGELFAIRKGERKICCDISNNDFVNKKIKVILNYRDKLNNPLYAVFL